MKNPTTLEAIHKLMTRPSFSKAEAKDLGVSTAQLEY